MRILLLGVGPAFAWTRDFLQAAIAAQAGATRVGAAREGAERVGIIELVALDEVPTSTALAALLAEPPAALVLTDHRPFAVTFAGASPAGGTLEAVRDEASRAVAALAVARHALRTLRLDLADAAAWPAALTGLLGQLLPGVVAALDFAARDLATDFAMPGVAALEDAPATLVTALLSGYLKPLFDAVGPFGSGPPGPMSLVWPRECFLDGDSPGAPLPATVEIAGRARILAYGPYLPLPVGSWTATAWLGFSAEIGRVPFILEVDTGEAVTRGFFEVEHGGIFTLKLDFRVVWPLVPIEVRLISQDATLEGLASLIEVGLVQSLA